MKTIFLSLLALVTLTMVACGSDKLIETQKAILTESINSIDSVQTMEALQLFQDNFAAKQQAFIDKNTEALKNIESDVEKTKEIRILQTQLISKMQNKVQELIALQMSADTTAIIETQEAL